MSKLKSNEIRKFAIRFVRALKIKNNLKKEESHQYTLFDEIKNNFTEKEIPQEQILQKDTETKKNDLLDDIIEFLRKNPWSKARAVGNYLSLHKSEINPVLYSKQGTLFIQNENYEWNLK